MHFFLYAEITSVAACYDAHVINAWPTVVTEKNGTNKKTQEIYNANSVICICRHMQPDDRLIYPRQRHPSVTAAAAAAAAAEAATTTGASPKDAVINGTMQSCRVFPLRKEFKESPNARHRNFWRK